MGLWEDFQASTREQAPIFPHINSDIKTWSPQQMISAQDMQDSLGRQKLCTTHSYRISVNLHEKLSNFPHR